MLCVFFLLCCCYWGLIKLPYVHPKRWNKKFKVREKIRSDWLLRPFNSHTQTHISFSFYVIFIHSSREQQAKSRKKIWNPEERLNVTTFFLLYIFSPALTFFVGSDACLPACLCLLFIVYFCRCRNEKRRKTFLKKKRYTCRCSLPVPLRRTLMFSVYLFWCVFLVCICLFDYFITISFFTVALQLFWFKKNY